MIITTEQERLQASEAYAQERIRDLRAAISQCDYSEDVNGYPVWDPGCYPEEKREYTARLREWEKMLGLLTGNLPFSTPDL